MKITHLKNAGVLIEDKGTSLLCDPWLVDGAYYGSWTHYPPCELEPEDFNDVDYIYVSHIHPDHSNAETLNRMDTDIPVLIHDFKWDWLQRKVEALGFDVVELSHDKRFHIGGDLHINILAADNCNPELCGKYMECSWVDQSNDDEEYGSTQLDTVAVIDNGDSNVVHINDAPYQLAKQVGRVIKRRFENINLLLTPYAGASAYPHCFDNLSPKEKQTEAQSIIQEKLENQAISYIKLFEPDYVMPFSGEYLLTGDLAELNEYLAVPERSEAREYIVNHSEVDYDRETCILLNCGEHFDLNAETQSATYSPVDSEARERYIQNELKNWTFTYENNDCPSLANLRELVPKAHERLQDKREQIGFQTDTKLIVELIDDTFVKIALDERDFSYISESDIDEIEEYVRFSAPPKLTGDLLRGPRYAHWNNASIGSHLRIRREPNRYERGIYYCMNFFHS